MRGNVALVPNNRCIKPETLDILALIINSKDCSIGGVENAHDFGERERLATWQRLLALRSSAPRLPNASRDPSLQATELAQHPL